MEQALITQIQDSNDIVDVIGSYIKVKRTGSSFKAVCPFHNDKNPSLNISQKKQIFKCFACGKGGNVITFVRDYEKISFYEALKKLANRAGITIDDKPAVKSKYTEKREQLLEAYALAKNFYVENLNQYGETAKSYLQKRGLSQNTIKEFELGYSLDSFNGLKNYLLKESKIPKNILKISGLFKQGTSGNYDVFRNRLMFPIHSHLGKVVAFGGRILEEGGNAPKYVNSPTTDIYEKGKDVYGLFKTKYNISKIDFAVVVEGYMDFLRMYEQGIINAVSCLGTALTDDQVKIIGRYSENFVLLYDGDDAGQKAAMKAGFNITKLGFSAKVVVLPNAEDPDSFILKNGVDVLNKKIEAAQPFVNFVKDSKVLDKNEKEKIELLSELIQEINNPLAKELLMKEISEVFKISESIFYPLLSKGKKKILKINNKIMKNSEERLLIHYFLNNPEEFNLYSEEISDELFASDFYRDFFNKINDSGYFHTKSLQNAASLLNYFEEDKDMIDNISEMLVKEINDIDIEETIIALKIRIIQNQIMDIEKAIKQNPNDDELMHRKSALKSKFQRFSHRVVKKTIR